MLAFVLLLLVLPAQPARAELVLPAGELVFVRDLATHAVVARDPDRAIAPEVAAEAPGFASPGRYVQVRATRGAYWLRVPIENRGPARVLRFDTGRPHLIEATTWIAGADDRIAPVARAPARTIAFDVTVPPGRSTLVMRYRSFAGGWLAPVLGPRAAVAARTARQDVLAWGLNGALLALVAVGLVLTPLVGRRVGLAFVLYVGAGFAFVFQADGYARALLWPGWAGDSEQVNLLLSIALVAAALHFARSLFDTGRSQPGWDRVYRGTLWALAGAAGAMTVAYGAFAPLNLLAYLIVAATALLHPVIAVQAWRAGQVGSGPFLVSSPLILGSMAFAAAAVVLPGRVSVEATLDVGHWVLILECLLFATAAMMRALRLREERDGALRAELAAARAQAELERALRDSERRYERARSQAVAQGDRLAHLWHDIRQPLFGLRVAAEGPDLDPRVAARMREALDYLEDVAATHAEAAVQPTGREAFALAGLLDNVAQMFEEEARAKGLTLAVEGPALRAHANPVAVMRIVSNLVANAIRHTQSGGIRLICQQARDAVQLTVADDGPGMTPEALASVLRPGAKGADSRGSGLGLGIVAALARDEGLDLHVDSAPGAGTRVTLTVPMTETSDMSPVQPDAVTT